MGHSSVVTTRRYDKRDEHLVEESNEEGGALSEAGAPGLTLAKYRQQGSLANAILKSTPLSGKAHEIFDDEPSASEGVPARGSKTIKPSATNTGLSL